MKLLAQTTRWTAAALLLTSCALQPYGDGWGNGTGAGGKADSDYAGRFVDVILTNPPCDICTGEDKEVLRRNSEIIERVVARIDAAQYRIDIAQFTWSVREIADAVMRAHERGVTVRIAMDDAQSRPGSVSADLQDAGLNVRFVHGSLGQGERPHGLQHAKFMLIDYGWLITGSNNWSSTGTTINNENTLIVRTDERDPMMQGFSCHFEAIWESNAEDAGACSNEAAAFTPGTAAIRLIRDELRGAEESVDVMMHHLMFRDLVKELAKAAERGVHVRVLLNAANLEEHRGSSWDRLIAAGAGGRQRGRFWRHPDAVGVGWAHDDGGCRGRRRKLRVRRPLLPACPGLRGWQHESNPAAPARRRRRGRRRGGLGAFACIACEHAC